MVIPLKTENSNQDNTAVHRGTVLCKVFDEKVEWGRRYLYYLNAHGLILILINLSLKSRIFH